MTLIEDMLKMMKEQVDTDRERKDSRSEIKVLESKLRSEAEDMGLICTVARETIQVCHHGGRITMNRMDSIFEKFGKPKEIQTYDDEFYFRYME